MRKKRKSGNSGCLFSLFGGFKRPNGNSNGILKFENKQFDPEYSRKYLLTKNELYFYRALKPIADKYHLVVLSKIRMADLVEPKYNQGRSYAAFAKIRSKHVDFALCDPENLFVRLLIELDDSSHVPDNERDRFVEMVYNQTGYKLLRINGAAGLEEKIRTMLN